MRGSTWPIGRIGTRWCWLAMVIAFALLPLRSFAEQLYGLARNDGSVFEWNADTGAFAKNFGRGEFNSTNGQIQFGPDGMLWGLGWSGGLVRIDPHTGLTPADQPAWAAALGMEGSFAFDGDGHVYGLTRNSGQIIEWDWRTGVYVKTFGNGAFSPTGYITFGPDGMLWGLGWGGGLVKFDPTTGHWAASQPAFASPLGVYGTFAFDGNGHIFGLPTNGGGIIEWDWRTGEFVKSFGAGAFSPTGEIKFGSDGMLWGLGWAGGLVRFDPSTGQWLGNQPNYAASLSQNSSFVFSVSTVPAPSGLATAALGLLTVIACCRRRRSPAPLA